MSILFTNVTTQGENPLKQGYLATADGKITYMGQERPQGDFSREISCEDKILMAGLVNAHTHVPMSLLRGIGGGHNLQDWLNKFIFPAEARLDSRAVAIGTELSIAELLACGVTSFADMYDFVEDIAQVVAKTGINANLSRGVLCFDPSADLDSLQGIQDTKALLKNWQNHHDGQIRCDLSLHGEYTSFPKLWDYMGNMVAETGARIHIHVSETKSEHEECKGRNGTTPLQILERHGVWANGGLAAHCVWTEEADWDLMVKRDISPVHNPVSNLKLGSGVAPISGMLEKGVNVALGTDGVASNNNHDLWEEMKLTAMLHKGVALDPTLISSQTALEIATKNGGKALGRKTGVLEVGYDADLILVDFSSLSMIPCHDVTENLVFSARGSDVCLTMCRGKVLYENGVYTTIDVEKLKKEVKDYGVPCILGELGT
ncbi:MAG: amidohydrolase [Eubacteriales bacterium]